MSERPVLRVARNTVVGFLAQVSGKALSYAFLLYVTRTFGAGLFGAYLTVGTLVGLLGDLTDVGLSTLTVREVGRDRGSIGRYLAIIGTLKMGLAAVGFGVLLVGVRVMGFPSELVTVVTLAGVSLFPSSVAGVLAAGLAGLGLIHLAALWGVVTNLVITGSSVLALALGYGLGGVFAASTASSFVSMAGLLGLVRRAGVRGPFAVQWHPAWQMVRKALPFAASAWLAILYFRVDVLIVSQLEGHQAVGWYGAALRPLEILFFIPSSLMSALFPLMAFHYQRAPDRFWRSFEGSVTFMIRLALPLATGLAILSERVVVILYGGAFLPAAPALAILAWAMALGFVNAPVTNVVFSSEFLPRCLPYMVFHACVKFFLTLGLVSWMGYRGACVAILLGELVGFLLNLRYLSLIVGKWPSYWRAAVRPTLSAAGMGIVLLALYPLNLGVLLGIGCLVYVTLLMAFGEFKGGDLRALGRLGAIWRA